VDARQERIYHDVDCPARDIAERRIAATCTCPGERWLDPRAEPVKDAARERLCPPGIAILEGAAGRAFSTPGGVRLS